LVAETLFKQYTSYFENTGAPSAGILLAADALTFDRPLQAVDTQIVNFEELSVCGTAVKVAVQFDYLYHRGRLRLDWVTICDCPVVCGAARATPVTP
jgi:hypothetical protein